MWYIHGIIILKCTSAVPTYSVALRLSQHVAPIFNGRSACAVEVPIEVRSNRAREETEQASVQRVVVRRGTEISASPDPADQAAGHRCRREEEEGTRDENKN